VVNKADGSILLSLDVALTPELVQWVLGFGAFVRVVQPAALAEKISESAAQIVALYDEKGAA
jgi:predicted DNA-binding transcriptional regulator YafY